MPDFEKLLRDIEEGIPPGAYRSRLIEELRDHMDDAIHLGALGGRPTDQVYLDTVRSLGSSKEIISEFNIAMKYTKNISIWMEALSLGFTALPLYMLSVCAPANIFPIYFIDHRKLAFIIYALLNWLIFFLFYRSTLPRIFRFQEARTIVPHLLAIFIIPSFCFAIFEVFQLYGAHQYLDESPMVSIASLLALFVPNLHALYYTKKKLFSLKLENVTATKPHPFIDKIVSIYQYPKLSIEILCVIFILFSFNAYTHTYSFDGNQFSLLAKPRGIVDVIFHLPFLLMTYPKGFWILNLFYIFIIIISLWSIGWYLWEKHTKVYNVSFPWFRFILLTYILSNIFLLQPPVPSIQWQTESKNISDEVQWRQIGISYRLIASVNTVLNDAGPILLYEIKADPSSDGFIIKTPNNNGEIDTYRLSSIHSLASYSLDELNNEPLSGINLGIQPIPNEISCIPFDSEHQQNGEVMLPEDYSRICRILKYKNQIIFDAQPGLYQLDNFVVNSDKTWALIHIEKTSQATSPSMQSYIYLIPLQKA